MKENCVRNLIDFQYLKKYMPILDLEKLVEIEKKMYQTI